MAKQPPVVVGGPQNYKSTPGNSGGGVTVTPRPPVTNSGGGVTITPRPVGSPSNGSGGVTITPRPPAPPAAPAPSPTPAPTPTAAAATPASNRPPGSSLQQGYFQGRAKYGDSSPLGQIGPRVPHAPTSPISGSSNGGHIPVDIPPPHPGPVPVESGPGQIPGGPVPVESGPGTMPGGNPGGPPHVSAGPPVSHVDRVNRGMQMIHAATGGIIGSNGAEARQGRGLRPTGDRGGNPDGSPTTNPAAGPPRKPPTTAQLTARKAAIDASVAAYQGDATNTTRVQAFGQRADARLSARIAGTPYTKPTTPLPGKTAGTFPIRDVVQSARTSLQTARRAKRTPTTSSGS